MFRQVYVCCLLEKKPLSGSEGLLADERETPEKVGWRRQMAEEREIVKKNGW